MSDERLTTLLAERILSWTAAPDRYLVGNRSWIPCWRFQPLERLEDAFRLLEKAQPEHYSMGAGADGAFSVQVRTRGSHRAIAGSLFGSEDEDGRAG